MYRSGRTWRFTLSLCGFLALLLAGSTVAGGHNSLSKSAATERAPAAQRATVLQGSPGKTRAALDIRFDSIRAATTGLELPVNLGFVPGHPAQRIEVRINAGDGLFLADGASIDFVDAPLGAEIAHRVLVVPQRVGMAYLNVIATMITENGREVRTIAVPVRTGDADHLLESCAGEDANGEAVVSLPAVEMH